MSNTIKERYLRLILLLSPSVLRRGILVVIARSFAAALESIYNSFTQYKEEVDYYIAHNSQVFSLQAAINDVADPTDRRCKVYSPEGNTNLVLYKRSAKLFKIIPERDGGSLIVPKRGVTLLTTTDFIVSVPADAAKDSIIYATINKYKLTSKRFKIIRSNGENN